jgi:hypothetical protein
VRPRVRLRSLAALTAVSLLAACSGSRSSATTSPSSPEGQVPTGQLVLRVTSFCTISDSSGVRVFPEVRTRVTVSRVNAEWVGLASAPAAGDVEVRFHQAAVAVAGIVPIAGTITGTAIHMPELAAGLPAWDSRIDFGGDGRTTLSGITFMAGALATTNGIDGTGAGPVTLSDTAGHSCSSAGFSWSLFPPA